MKRERKPYGGQNFESTALIFTGLAQNQKVRQVVFVKKYFPVFRYLWSIAAQRRNRPDLRSPQTARVDFFFRILGFLFSFFSESSAVTPFSESSAVTRKPQPYRAFIFRLVVLKKCAMILLPTFLINAPPVATSRAVNEAALGSGTSLAVRHTGLLFWHMVGLKKRYIPKCFNLLGLHPSRASISLGSLRSNHSMWKETHFVSSSKYRWVSCFLAFHLMCHILAVGASTPLSFLFSEQISLNGRVVHPYFH